ncbi:MAG: hypothetical protein H6713_09090 [Myxococcales bacterium]|nr:hypothetical protein [Myxococcales bacterium]
MKTSRPSPRARPRTRGRCSASLLALTLALACTGRDAPTEDEALALSSAPDEDPSAPPPRVEAAPTRDVDVEEDSSEWFVVHEPAAFPEPSALASITALDLAFAEEDRIARLDSGADDCARVDLSQLADRMPALERLRISGCAEAARVALESAGAGLRELELANLTLGTATLVRLAGMPGLRALTLTRVRLEPTADAIPLRGLSNVERMTLRELERDTALSMLLQRAPRLREANIIGAWAGHRAMESLAEAKRLERLTLVDTRVGNFSLNKLKGLERLSSVEWRGATFNNNSPLYLRELPVTSFTCACPGLGDAGLASLRRVQSLARLELPESAITGAGLASLEVMPALAEVIITGRDIGPEGFAALAAQPALARLELVSERFADPTLKHLGELVNLRWLALDCPEFDDRGAAQLAGLARLEHLDLGGTAISDRGLAFVEDMHALEVLRLHHTRVTNRGLAHLAGLRSLRVLELDHTDVVDAGVAHLAGLEQLRELRLDDTLITDAALPHIAALPRLQQLNLANTVVTRQGVRALESLPALTAVNLSGTRAAADE